MCMGRLRGTVRREAYLLGAVGSEHEHSLVLIGQGDAVDERPDVAKAAGGELHTGREAELRVTRELGVGFTIVEEVLPREVSLKSRDKILGCDTVA